VECRGIECFQIRGGSVVFDRQDGEKFASYSFPSQANIISSSAASKACALRFRMLFFSLDRVCDQWL
jgi:hypothetical protein